jgi:pimeloyl-ACP methyl ester carboxylesterase
MEYQDIFTDTRNKRIHSIACGNGPLSMHFLHANGFCAGVYMPFYKILGNDCRILASDIPGHGDSDHHGQPRIKHWDIFVNDISDALCKNMNTPVIGVGHSLGAVVTLLAAARNPDLFSHIVLMEPVIFTPPRLAVVYILKRLRLLHQTALAQGARRRKSQFTSREEAYRRFSSGRGLFSSWPDEYIRSFCKHGLAAEGEGPAQLKCDPETEAQIYESLILDIWSYPKKVRCPVLIIRGATSDTFTEAASKKLCKSLSKGNAITIPKAGHFVPMEQSGACTKQILDFVSNYS